MWWVMGQLFINDQKIMDEIIDISMLIGNIYQRLFSLYVKGAQNSKEYVILLQELEKCQNIEKSLYEKLNVTPEKASNLIDYLVVSERFDLQPGNNVLHAIYIEDYESLYPYRIVNKLIDLSFQNKQNYLEWLVEEGNFLDTISAESYFKIKKFESSIDSDFERIFMCHLNEELDNDNTDKEREWFARIKYNLSFISNNIEKTLTDPNNVNSDFYYTFPFVGEINDIDIEYCEDIQIEKSSAYISHAMRGIFIKDSLVDEDVEIDFRVFKIYMRTGLGFIYEIENYDELIDILSVDIIETNEEANNWLSISTNILLSEIDEIEYEKPKCKYLHFINKNNY